MSDSEFLWEAGLASVVCAVLVAIYMSGGLMGVIVSATLFDCALRRIETLRERRVGVRTTGDIPRGPRM